MLEFDLVGEQHCPSQPVWGSH